MGALRTALRTSGAIDARDQRVGGALTVVQLGDLIGRSDEERQVLDFAFDLQRRARQAGGAVHALVGNHEVMGGRLDNQAVGPNPFTAWEDVPGLRRDDPRLRHLPPYARARGAALMPGGPYADRSPSSRWSSSFVRRCSSTVASCRAGHDTASSASTARFENGCWDRRDEPDSALGVDDGDRVMWTREFSADVARADCGLLEESLKILGARRMIVAHTVQAAITSGCDGRLWAIDVGMSRARGGRVAEVLEIVDDSKLRVLRP